MAGTAFGGVSSSDDDLRRAEFARMLAENDAEANWMTIVASTVEPSGYSSLPVAAAKDDDNDCSEGRSGGSTPTITEEDDGSNYTQFEPTKIDPTQPDTIHIQVPDEVQKVRAKNSELSIEVDQLREQLEVKTLAHSEALVHIQLQDEQLKMEALASEAALNRVRAYEDEVNALQSQVNILQSENQQLAVSTTTVTGLMDRLEQSHKESNDDKVQIERLSQERLRLDEDVRRKDDANAKLHEKVLQSADKLSLLQHQLGRLSTVEAQLNEKGTELKTLRNSMEILSTEKNTQFQELCFARAELKESLNTNENHCKEMAALKTQVTVPQTDEEKNAQLKRSIALCVTRFDLGWDHSRVFSCKHDNLSYVRDGNKSTCQFNAKESVDDMFWEWSDDDDFIDKYRETRQYFIDHHRAHERDDPGRGEWAEYLKNLFTKGDRRRESSLTYN
ncbi:hypothetical protein P171DRAFT_480955 [Karstenula rhodostoma CBS 690.94]|uniref:Uncharacterized protein n=1 Tax=Karstenula rhodostoma CBS 690.94 TaxID=1392251 RepID=A0A9P4UFE0_9PLEO|nr:hypothetical protein P171DRAFT_480955 [Karstenula rhodostoma CBS 690.94]